ncbi:MAG TPA: FHA domain-containing protein [Candidatus Aquilonibacter sp.]|nr:FHA domain-containing protein [Candidatus Aquilonibacter sp.]
MAVVLEVKTGPLSGEKIVVRTGETVTFGRAAGRADFALPHDTFMSGIHFAVECAPQGPSLHDKNSSNGTFLNGARVKDSPLVAGDEIRSGQTSFSVRVIADENLPKSPPAVAQPGAPAEPPRAAVPDLFAAGEPRATARPQQRVQAPMPFVAPAIQEPAPPISPQPPKPVSVPPAPPMPPPVSRPVEPPRAVPVAAAAKQAVFTVGSWAFSVVPQGWTVKSEFGMEQSEKEGFPSSITATEEMIGGNPALGPFVESQLSMLRQYLREPKIEAAIPPAIPGAEEKASVDVRYSTNDGQTIFYRRVYARTGNTVGTITLMTLDSEFPSIRPSFEQIVAGVVFQPKVPA